MSKYLEFNFLGQEGKTRIWEVKSKRRGNTLGIIEWYGSWRQYVFAPSPNTIYNNECLRDIAEFIDEKNKRGKE